MKMIISHLITALLAIVVSYTVTMYSVDKKIKDQRIIAMTNDSEEEESKPIKYNPAAPPLSDDESIRILSSRIKKVEDYINEHAEIVSEVKKEYLSLKNEEKRNKELDNSFNNDLKKYPPEVQEKYKQFDNESLKFMKNHKYKECADSMRKGINLLDRKNGFIYGIGQHRLSWCLYNSGEYDEAKKQFEYLLESNNLGEFNNGVKISVKARVDLFRLCIQKKDYDCVEGMENELINIGFEKYSSKNTVDSVIEKIKLKYGNN